VPTWAVTAFTLCRTLTLVVLSCQIQNILTLGESSSRLSGGGLPTMIRAGRKRANNVMCSFFPWIVETHLLQLQSLLIHPIHQKLFDTSDPSRKQVSS
jgi:hypothetical protein